MNKKTPTPPALAPSDDFNTLAKRVFTVQSGSVYIGGEKLTPVMRELLRDQARNVQTMQLWEILHATIVQEAADLALRQSTNFEQVQFAKALHHAAHVIANVIHSLAQE